MAASTAAPHSVVSSQNVGVSSSSTSSTPPFRHHHHHVSILSTTADNANNINSNHQTISLSASMSPQQNQQTTTIKTMITERNSGSTSNCRNHNSHKLPLLMPKKMSSSSSNSLLLIKTTNEPSSPLSPKTNSGLASPAATSSPMLIKPEIIVVKSNADADSLKASANKELSSSSMIIAVVDDENSQNSNQSLNTNKSSSSSSSENSPKKKRRRGENERLMEDLQNIDSSLAANVTKLLANQQNEHSNDNQLMNSNHSTESTTNGGQDSLQLPSSTSPNKQNGSNADCPALHLRPRRNIRPPTFSGYYTSTSGSSSPIYLSPVKMSIGRNLNPTLNWSLLNDASKHLSKLLGDTNELNIKTEVDSIEHRSSSKSPMLSPLKNRINECKPKPKPVRSMANCIMRDVDVSVFATLITPNRLSLSGSHYYDYNYISLKILNHKPIRIVELMEPNSKQRFNCPLLELVTTDLNDRFDIDYMKGVFDDPKHSSASATELTVFLLGSYALKSKPMLNNGSVINIVKFRTKTLSSTNFSNQVMTIRNVKKRKLMIGAYQNSAGNQNAMNQDKREYPFVIIVDSPTDLKLMSNEDMKKDDDFMDIYNGVISLDDPFLDIYNNNNNNNSTMDKQYQDGSWMPLVSYSDKWRPPKDPRELNRSLYIIQPCIPKFESSSRTVKMSTTNSTNNNTGGGGANLNNEII